jgi:F0F1-type ATP synthase assembly protein I
MSTSRLTSVRSWTLRVVVGSFSLAALLGVAALLAPGRFGSVQGRILLTTVIVGASSVLVLCDLAVGGARQRWVGLLGGLAALVATCSLLLIVWAYWQHDPGRALTRTFGVSAILAVTSAQISLLVAVVRRPGLVRRLLAGTVLAGSAFAGLLIAAVLGWSPSGPAMRLIGIVGILDVLGTVVTIALGVFGREGRSLTVTVTPAVAARLRAESAQSGRPVGDLVDEALSHYLRATVG